MPSRTPSRHGPPAGHDGQLGRPADLPRPPRPPLRALVDWTRPYLVGRRSLRVARSPAVNVRPLTEGLPRRGQRRRRAGPGREPAPVPVAAAIGAGAGQARPRRTGRDPGGRPGAGTRWRAGLRPRAPGRGARRARALGVPGSAAWDDPACVCDPGADPRNRTGRVTPTRACWRPPVGCSSFDRGREGGRAGACVGRRGRPRLPVRATFLPDAAGPTGVGRDLPRG
jgi:hypothetical protein